MSRLVRAKGWRDLLTEVFQLPDLSGERDAHVYETKGVCARRRYRSNRHFRGRSGRLDDRT